MHGRENGGHSLLGGLEVAISSFIIEIPHGFQNSVIENILQIQMVKDTASVNSHGLDSFNGLAK